MSGTTWTTRRGSLARGAAGLAGALAAACDGRPSTPGRESAGGRGGAFDWRSATGRTITVLDKFGPANEFYATQVDAFRRLTGITVDYQMARDGDVRLKTLTAFTAGDASIDVFNSTTVQEGVRYLKAGWYAPLERYLRDRSLTAPDLDPGDFLDAPLATARVLPDNVLVGLPQDAEATLLFYNKSLFDRNGVPPPRGPAWAWKDLEEHLVRLHRPESAVSGLLMRHAAAAAIAHWSIFLHDRGGSWFDRDGRVSVSTPLALEATEHYGRLLRRLGPPELQQGAQLDSSAQFMAGKVGAILEQHPSAAAFLDPARSAVADFMGFAGVPSGPKGSAPLVFSWISSISNLSKQKEAAWLWVQWHTGKEASLRLGVEAGMPPSRRSAWDHPDFKARQKNPALMQGVLEMLRQPLGHGDWLPPVVNVAEARPIAGRPIEVAIQGGDFKAAAQEATLQLRQVVEQAGGR
jgi:multiple sugar transport system substrate-binding protein